MAYIRTVVTASGARAVQIVEKRRGQRRILAHVGSAHSDAELAVLKATARARINDGQQSLDVAVDDRAVVEAVFDGPDADGRQTGLDEFALFNAPPAPLPEPPVQRVAEGPRVLATASTVLWETLQAAYRAVGFDALGDEVFEQVVLARIVEPTSKLDAGRVLAELGQPGPHHTTIYRHLRLAQQRKYRDQLAAACYEHASNSGDVSLVLYDVTTLYFEAEKEDELRKVGFSKERRVDPQIVVGLLVDRGGFPLEIGCFEGNKAETTTIIPIVKAFQARHNLADMVVVADAGMLSETNLKDLDQAQLRFIVGSRQVKAPADLATHFHWHGDAFTDGQLIDTITGRRATKANTKPRTLRAEPVWDPQSHPGHWRAVWAYSRKRALRDNRTLNAQEARAKAVVKGDKPARKPRFVKADQTGLALDQSALNRARSLVGLKGYVTNIPNTIMGPGEVVSSYHDLWHVEDSFRMAKSDLRARPIFHHLKESIEAHLTIAFASLAVARYLRTRTGLSTKKLVHTLAPLRSATITVNGSTHHIPPAISDDTRTIIETVTANPNPKTGH